MAGHHDRNPFDENVNPFSHPLKPTLFPLPPEPADFNNYYHGETIDNPLDKATVGPSSQALKKKEKELQAKEAELIRREQEVKRREEALARAGIHIQVKNWPPFYPILHHNIEKDIPLHLQRLQYVALGTFIGIALCLFWNIVSVTAAWVNNKEAAKLWFLAIVYFVIGVPLEYLCWYRPLYRALRTDSSWSYGWFFLNYILHIGFCIFVALAPPILFGGNSISGLLTAIDTFNKGPVWLGIFFLIGFLLFTLEALVSIWVIQKVYRHFRGGGRTATL